jgi:hydrogenase nickel incorporation protein HypA/HybF
MSIVQNILEIIKQEMAKHDCSRLVRVKINHGKLSNVVPESLEFAWQALTIGTDFESATFEAEEIPLRLRCAQCGEEFEPESASLLLAPCPKCGEDLGHEVLSGRELYIDHLEAE